MRKPKFLIFAALTAAIYLAAPLFSVRAQAAPAAAAPTVARNYIIKLRGNGDLPALLRQSGLVDNASNDSIERKFIFSDAPQFRSIYSFTSPASPEFLRQKLAGTFEYLDVDQPVVAKADNVQLQTAAIDGNGLSTNDPGFTLNPADTDHEWALPKVGFTNAWNRTTGSNAVIVAIIDTGVDETHEDLQLAKFAPGINLLNGLTINPGSNTDDNGHGTLVAGVIGATPNNGLGISGAAWRVTMLPVKALNAQGSGTSSDISQAIVWAADHGAHIINMSLGGLGFGHDTTLADAISYAFNKNVLIIAAAGNDVATTGGNLDQSPVFPICDDNGKNMILGVTASDVNDKKPDFANYGKACVDISSPGKRILSTINHDPANGAAVANAYAYASGTSLAVPYVSAQAALLKALYPVSTNQQLRDRIISTADNINGLNPTQCGGGPCAGLLGAGRINVQNSLVQAITPTVAQGDLVQAQENGIIYYINGGKRQPVSSFVRQQRFASAALKPVSLADLAQFPEGTYAEPLDGTLLKADINPTVYQMSKGLKLPISFQVFQMYHYSFANVHSLDNTQVSSWITGSYLTPPEGTLVRSAGNPTVYWTLSGVLHPINFNFYVFAGLNIFPLTYVSDTEIRNFPKGDAYTR